MNVNVNVSVILLAGGVGSRMKASVPKQFLLLNEKNIAKYSFDLFLSMEEVVEMVVVCAPEHQHLFQVNHHPRIRLAFALPGNRRQDSVYHGFQALKKTASLVCIHDSARPFITTPLVQRVLHAASEHGAATAAMPVKFTVKESNHDDFVVKTPDRAHIWEIQTPQVIRSELLEQGFACANASGVTVTDDVSLVELLNHPVKLVEGSYQNLKITTPEDLIIAQTIANSSVFGL